MPSLIIYVSLIFLNNSWNHSTDKSKSQFYADTDFDYWKLFFRSWKYPPRPSASGNISDYGEIIFNSHLNISNYLYISVAVPLVWF